MEVSPERMEQATTYISWLHVHAADGRLPATRPIRGVPVDVQRAVREWIRTARSSGGWAYPENWLPSQTDATRSSILVRLLSGADPLPQVPPTAYGYPWYEPVEDGRAYLAETDIELVDGSLPEGATSVVICETRWHVHHHSPPPERPSDGTLDPDARPRPAPQYIVAYDAHGEWLLRRLSPEEMTGVPSHRCFGGSLADAPAAWVIERLIDPHLAERPPSDSESNPFAETYDPFADRRYGTRATDPFVDDRHGAYSEPEPEQPEPLEDDGRSLYERSVEDDPLSFDDVPVFDEMNVIPASAIPRPAPPTEESVEEDPDEPTRDASDVDGPTEDGTVEDESRDER